MASMLRKITAEDRREAADALDDLKATLAYAGTQLPSPESTGRAPPSPASS